MTDTNTTQLQPCPFCGSLPVLQQTKRLSGDPRYFVECPECLTATKNTQFTLDSAKAEWTKLAEKWETPTDDTNR